MTEDFQEVVLRRLGNLETHIINLIYPLQNINVVFTNTKRFDQLIKLFAEPLKIDDRALHKLLVEFKNVMEHFEENIKTIDLKQTFGEIKYIAKRLHEIEERLSKIENQRETSNVKLEVRLNGKDLVEKPLNYDDSEQKAKPQKDLICEALDTLPQREHEAVALRLGLYSGEKITYRKLGEYLKVCGSRAGEIYKKGLRKLRHASRVELVKKANHPDLNLAVFGEVELP